MFPMVFFVRTQFYKKLIDTEQRQQPVIIGWIKLGVGISGQERDCWGQTKGSQWDSSFTKHLA
jgi:hypothetical protein